MADRRKRTNWYVGPKDDVKRAQLAELEAGGGWVWEEKHDGVWALVKVIKGQLMHAESRVGVQFVGADWDNDLHGLQMFPSHVTGVMIAELVADWIEDPKTKLPTQGGTRRLHVFDLIFCNTADGVNPLPPQEHDFRNLPLRTRRARLEELWKQRIDDGGLTHLVEQRATGAQAFFDEVIARNGEGLVGKKLSSYHVAKNSDGKIEHWIRCKPRRSIDYVVMGTGFAEKGTPNLDLGLYKLLKEGRKLVKVQATGIPKEWEHIAHQEWVGQVVEVVGQEIFPSGALRFGQIKKPRPDKRPEDCTYEAALRAVKVVD
jgi:hypothetical protein